MQVVATACLFLAGKVEDTPRSLQRIAETMYKAFCLNVANVSKEKADARWEDTVCKVSHALAHFWLQNSNVNTACTQLLTGSTAANCCRFVQLKSVLASAVRRAFGVNVKFQLSDVQIKCMSVFDQQTMFESLCCLVQAYQENFKAAVLAAERALLFTLGFNFRIDTPHKCLFNVQGIAHQLQGPIEQACAASKVDLHPAQVQQAAYDLCNEWYVLNQKCLQTNHINHCQMTECRECSAACQIPASRYALSNEQYSLELSADQFSRDNADVNTRSVPVDTCQNL